MESQGIWRTYIVAHGGREGATWALEHMHGCAKGRKMRFQVWGLKNPREGANPPVSVSIPNP